jgi:putative glutamine amidotransferase
VHGQAVDRLGTGLSVEATAPDGTVEAVRVREAAGFAWAVQWHPEWDCLNDARSMALFRAFGAACRAYAGEAA